MAHSAQQGNNYHILLSKRVGHEIYISHFYSEGEFLMIPGMFVKQKGCK